MTTLANLKQTIADDLHRTDLTQAISDAINSAIRHYQREDWWFLEDVITLTASAQTATSPLPVGFEEADSMLVTVSGSKTPVIQWTYEEIEEKDWGNTFGIPTRFAIYNNSFRWYPVPNANYLITLSQDADIDAPSDAASNSWTSVAYDLIRNRVEWDVALHRMHNPDMAMAASSAERAAYLSLIKEDTRKKTTGKFKKSWW